MRVVRTWPRDIGLAIVVVIAVSFVQLAGQGGGRRFIAVDVVGNFSPGIPPGSQWPLQYPPFAVAFSLARGANGNILFTGAPGYSVVFGEMVSVPNNTSGQGGFVGFNSVGDTEEVLAPRGIADGACWSGGGTCQYVADDQTCSIYQRDAQSGSIQRIIGTGTCPSSPPSAPIVNGSNRLQTEFSEISAIGFTAAEGLVFGACSANRTAIYRATPGLDTIEYLAGNGATGTGTSGPATATAIGCPIGPIISALEPLESDPSQVDGVAVAIQNQHLILRVSAAGQLSRLAGDGVLGDQGDNDVATSARLAAPRCIARYNSVYDICDTGNYRIRRVDNATGIITTVAGNGSSNAPPHGGAALNSSAGSINAIAFDTAGNRYVVDEFSWQVGVYSAATSVYSLLFGGAVTAFDFPATGLPGNATALGGAAGLARIDGPAGLEGLLIGDTFTSRVLKWDANTNRVTLFAGGGPMPTNGSAPPEGVPANQSLVFFPADVVRNSNGVTYIAEWFGCRILKVDADGILTTAVGIFGLCSSAGDGLPAINATVSLPYGMALAPDGRLFWGEGGSGSIRQLATNGTVSRIAGNGTPGFSGDGGPAIDAQLSAYADVDLSPDGRFLFVSDWANHVIRAIDLSLSPPVIKTIAGTPLTPGNTGDGGPANQAKLRYTEGVSLSGNLLAISDQDNHRIRMVTFPANASSLDALGSGIITTIFGTGVPGRMGRGVLDAVNARVNYPFALAPLTGAERGWFYTEQGGLTVGKLLELGAPNAPSGFAATVSGNFVTLAWTPPDTGAPATTYRVFARLTPGGPVVATLDVTDPLLIVDAVPNGTYFVSARGSNRFGDGPESAQRTVTVPQPYVAAGAPRNLSAIVRGSQVTLRWQPPATGGAPTQYVVAPAMTPGGPPITLIPIGGVADVAADGTQSIVTSFTAVGVPLGTYYVRLHATNPANSALSPPSNEVTVVVAPPSPPVLNAPSVAGSTVSLTWTAGAGPVAETYLLVAALSPGGAPIASMTTTVPSLTTTGVPKGTYYVRVRAQSSAGQSAFSNEVAVVVN